MGRRVAARDRHSKHISQCVVLSLLIVLILGVFTRADEIPEPPWGFLAPLEMGRDYLADDPAADAAVVFDKGDIIVGPGFSFSLLRRCRVQIFSPAGYRYATTKIPYHRGEKIINLRAHTITPDGRRVEVPEDRIYKIDNGRWRALVFAFPEVTPGCVVEYKYELQSRDFYYLRPWIFQTEIPTEYSQLVVHLPPGFEYAAVVSGDGQISSPTKGEYYSPEHRNSRLRTYSWVARDLPPLRPVDYLTSIEDYRARLDFQVIRYRTRDADREFIESWPDLIERVRIWYDDLLHLPKKSRERVAQLASDVYNIPAYANRAYEFCRDSIALARSTGSVSAEDLRLVADVLEGRRGSAVEKNLLLIALLRWAGLRADPVLISTRDHLRFDPRDRRLDQFNHVLVRLELQNKIHFLDTTDPAGWFGLLPPTACVERGVWIAPHGGTIIEIPPPIYDHSADLQAELTLNADGTASGRMTGTLVGYRAWEWARKSTPAEFEQFIRSTLISRTADITVVRVDIPPDNADDTVHFSMEFVWEGAAMVGADRLYIRPSGLFGLAENPFINPERQYPISFAFPYQDRAQVVWHLPPGCALVEVPDGGMTQANFLAFSCEFSSAADKVIARRKLSVERRDFPRSAYGEIKGFFDRVVEIDRDLAVGVLTESPKSADNTR